MSPGTPAPGRAGLARRRTRSEPALSLLCACYAPVCAPNSVPLRARLCAELRASRGVSCGTRVCVACMDSGIVITRASLPSARTGGDGATTTGVAHTD